MALVVFASITNLMAKDDAKSAATGYFSVVEPIYNKYKKECLGGNIPTMANIRNAKCSFYDERFNEVSKNEYSKIKKDVLGGLKNIEDMQSLNQVFADAYSENADKIYNEQLGAPHLFKKIEHRIVFKPEIIGIRIADKTKLKEIGLNPDFNVEVLFAVSNFKKLYNEVEPNYYTIMHDGILYLKCDDLEKFGKCEIDPRY